MPKISLKQYLTFGSLIFLMSALISGLWYSLRTSSLSDLVGATDDRGFEKAYVSRVIDGDTLELHDGRKVRYIGIDTPETQHPTKGQECFGQEASRRNQELVLNQVIQLEKDVSQTDRYGRLLRYVWLDDTMINYQLVAEGMAFASSYPPDIKHQARLRTAEHQARQEQVGLWGSCELPQLDELNSTLDLTDETVLGATASGRPSSGCVIKGNISSNGYLYHLPECSSYSQTKIDEADGERWFCTEAEAQAAGWRKSGSCP